MCYRMRESVPSRRRVRLVYLGGSKMYASGSIANSQRSPTEINNGAISKLRILEECRAFKAIISNEILV